MLLTLIEFIVMMKTSHLTSGNPELKNVLNTGNLILFICWILVYIMSFLLLCHRYVCCIKFTKRIEFHVSEVCMLVLEGLTIGFSYLLAKQEGKSVQDYSSSADEYRSVIFILSIVFASFDFYFCIKNLFIKNLDVLLRKKFKDAMIQLERQLLGKILKDAIIQLKMDTISHNRVPDANARHLNKTQTRNHHSQHNTKGKLGMLRQFKNNTISTQTGDHSLQPITKASISTLLPDIY
jgi:hypothetical protein